MGRTMPQETTSLTRLKALDDLKEISLQLQEAQQLCNHGARAEMILRWLVAKLRSSSETRCHPGSWQLFTSCIRLLPAQKIASILGSGALQEILQTTCAEGDLSKQCLSAISSSWKCLETISQSQSAVRSLLKIDGIVAAEICGNWYQHVRMFLQGHEPGSMGADVSLLDFGLELWSLHQPSTGDVAAFNDRCMTHVCHLALVLRRGGASQFTKRKRESHASDSNLDPIRALEASLAQHTILPARSSFFALRQRRVGHKKERFSENEQNVTDVFSSLSREQHSAHEVVPVILDIALRSVSTPTAGQRNHEAPWIEALFDALLALLDGHGRTQRTDAVPVMLRSLWVQKSTLSTQTLLSLAHRALSTPMEIEDDQWNVLAEIAALNSSVLTDRSITKQLFAAIGTRSSRNREADLLQTQARIITPLIDAFVRKLQHEELLELWHAQLADHAGAQTDKIWSAVVANVADAISQSVQSASAIALLDHYSARLRQLTLSEQNLSGHDALHQLEADLIVLRAVLLGARRDVHASANKRAVRDLWITIISSKSIDALRLSPTCRRELWQLLSVLSELHWPDSIAARLDGSDVESMFNEALASPVLKAAFEECTSSSASMPAAKILLAAICDTVRRYDPASRSAGVLLEFGKLLCAHPESSVIVLAEYPELVATLPSKRANDALRAMISTPGHHAQRLLSQIVARNAHANEFGNLLDEFSPQQYETLASAPINSAQRGDIVYKLLDLETIRSSSSSPDRYLALILVYLSDPVEETRLRSIALNLFHLAELWPTTKGSTERSGGALKSVNENGLRLLPMTVRAVYRAVGAAKKIDKAELCGSTFKRIRQLIEADASSKDSADARNFLVSITIACFEELVGSEEKPYAPRDESTLCTMIEKSVTGLESTNLDATGGHHVSHSTAAEALLVVPDTLWTFIGAMRKKFVRRILKSGDSILQADLNVSGEVLAANFRLICRYGDLAQVSAAAPRILSLDLGSKSAREVQDAYEQAVGTKVSTDTIAQLLSSATPHTSAAAQIRMHAIRKLQELSTDTPGYTTADVWQYLLRTLHNTQDLGVRRVTLRGMTSLLKSSKQALNQYNLEETLTALHHLLVEAPHIEADYAQICFILKVLLNQHRTQLQGRFHLVTKIFQALLSVLFDDTTSALSDRIREWHARLVAKLLQMVCKPVWTRSTTASSLTDASREAQKYAGHFVQHILAHYCVQLLSSTSAEVVRMALRPGVFAMIEAMEAFNEAAITSLSAAMNSNERAILRIVVQDWRQFGKWGGS